MNNSMAARDGGNLDDETLRATGRKRCKRCRRAKPIGHYHKKNGGPGWTRTYCKVCSRLITAEYTRSEQGKAKRAAYRARPEAIEKKKEQDRSYRRRIEWWKAYRSTPRGKLLHSLNQARYELKGATDKAKKARLKERIKAYVREIDRIEREMADKCKRRRKGA